MNSHFLNGFADELTKEAAHPLFTSVKKGGTLLGRKVKGAMARAMKRGKVKVHRMRKKAAPSARLRAGANNLSPTELRAMERSDKAKYGGGAGNFGGTQAPAFTADTKKGKIGNPSENPQNFGKKAMDEYGTGCGPKQGCGKGKHGKGCGLKQRAGSVLRTAIKGG